MMAQADLVAQMRAMGYTDAAMRAVLAAAGYGSGISVPAVNPAQALDQWIGASTPAQPVTTLASSDHSGGIATALSTLGVSKALQWLISLFGLGAIGAALVALIGKDTILSWVGGAIATILPGQQEWLGEYPAGLGQIEGRLVQKWTAGGQRTYFASFEQPTRTGARIQFYAYSSKRNAWLPYSYKRNIVIGAKELQLASALGYRRHVGKKKLLQLVAGKKK